MENQIIGPILPLRDLVVYPSITSPLFVGRAKSIDAINFAMNNNNKIIYLFTQKEPTTDDPQVNDVYSYGVKSKIIQFLKLPDNTYKVLTEGLEIVKIKSAVKASNNFLTAKIEPVVINKKNSVELKASLRVLKRFINIQLILVIAFSPGHKSQSFKQLNILFIFNQSSI